RRCVACSAPPASPLTVRPGCGVVYAMRTGSRLPCALALFAALGLVPRAANANMAAPQRAPSVLMQASSAGSTPLTIDREQLIIDCDGVDEQKRPRCWFEATYWVRNPTGQPQRVTTGFLSDLTDDVSISIDGQRSDRILTEAEVRALVPRQVPGTPPDQRFAQPPDAPAVEAAPRTHEALSAAAMMDRAASVGEVRGVDLAVAPGAVRELTAKGRLVPGEYWVPSPYFVTEPGRARHPLLAPERRTGVYEIEYLIAPIRTWGGVGPIDVVIRHPRAWEATASADAQQSRSVGGDQTEIRFTTRAEALAALRVRFRTPVRTFHPGGPVAGIGGTFGDAGGFRMRFGWELSAPDWLLYSATMDTDFDDVVVVTPMIEAATPWMLIIPSLGAGLGVPVRVEPDREVGVRLQGTAAFGPAAWVTSFDYYPGVDADRPDDKQVTMLFQLTL
ncbi:MAG: hypothetical protein ACOC1F_08640, partial [Myxococcota bacterium]